MLKYRLATFQDNSQLLKLTSATGMSGKIGLRIDRHPNFFALNKIRGQSKVYVAVDGDDIVGCICVSNQVFFINQTTYPLYYISDLKVAKTHRKRGIGLHLTNEVVKYLQSENADFAFLNISKGNKRPFVFFSDSAQYRGFENIGTFKTFQFIGNNKTSPNGVLSIRECKCTGELIQYLNDYYSGHDFARVVTRDDLEGTRILVIRESEQIRAVMCLIDTMGMKQNVVLNIPLHLKFLLGILNRLAGVLGMSQLPKENEAVKLLYIKYLAVPDYDKKRISMLISYAKNCAYEKDYSFVSLGLHERDPLIKKLPMMIKFTFYSVGMLLSMKNSLDLSNSIRHGVPYIDYSIV